ncbi:MAG TPA: DUF2252 family protein [Stellaceae bacterium]|nr:DUF2252 family protein [Stellaceae bacterium]
MDIVAATRDYERWLRKRIDVVEPDLRLKHRAMAEAAFPFLRATFYRWVMLWREICPDLAAAPKALVVGDLHVENFGTWRDREGRLAWGINDFDEAFPMPYTIDLVRLATSALLAIREQHLSIAPQAASTAIFSAYRDAIVNRAPEAFVLEETHPSLRQMALGAERDPVRFWAKIATLRAADPPRRVRKLLLAELPDCEGKVRLCARVAGLGSLGRPRYVAWGSFESGFLAREAKAMLPSAYGWAEGARSETLYLAALVARAVRSHDPYYGARKRWVLRRIGPHCSRISLADFPKIRNERHILRAMGHETANVHFGSPDALPAIRRDLKRRGGRWLHEAAVKMADATLADWRAWRRHAGT